MSAWRLSVRPWGRQRGVSLIEAVVALAIMGFGMLGVVAMQIAMRQSSDISKQRTEASRLAHAAIEARRPVSAMTATAGQVAWTDLVSPGAETIAGANATYTRTVTILDTGSGRSKNFVVDVQWTDRSGVAQSVRLVSSIAGSMPELAMSVGVPAWGDSKVRNPRGRNPAIPPAAVDQGDGTSKFTPPGSTSSWIFNNSTGYIEKSCNSAGVCTSVTWRLLAGFVAFQTGGTQPTPAEGENPTSSAFSLFAYVDVTSPVSTTINCFNEPFTNYYAYFCAVPVVPAGGAKWSGFSYLDGGSLNLASSLSDNNPGHYRVCRYTPVRNCQPAVGSTIWGAEGSTASCSGVSPTPSRKLTNIDHPLNYLDVTESLVNQNFLVIRAGDGTTAFQCPDDDSSTPLIQSTTWNHQPSS